MKPIFKTSQTSKDAYHDIDILAIDVSWVAKRHEHALGQRFETADGRMSGHIYGAFKNIRGIISALRPRRVAFCYDRGYKWRLKLCPTYKSSRRVPDGAEKQWSSGPDVERFFRTLPGMHLSYPDAEADDMIGWLAANHSREGAMVIYSKDKDLWQLVHDGDEIACMFPKKPPGPRTRSKDFWVREKQVREDFGVGPQAVAMLKAVLGDASDKIEGLRLKKTGKKDALREFVETMSAHEFFDPDEDNPNVEAPDWLGEALMKERPRLINNFLVTSIPNAVHRIDTDPVEETEADLAGAMDILAEFECHSLLAQMDPFMKSMQLMTSRKEGYSV